MWWLYFITCTKYRKFNIIKISFIFYKLVLSIISGKCDSKLIEILKIFGAINNMEEY